MSYIQLYTKIRIMNKNLTIQRINVSKGLSLYKTGRSPYDFARIWDPIEKKYR